MRTCLRGSSLVTSRKGVGMRRLYVVTDMPRAET